MNAYDHIVEDAEKTSDALNFQTEKVFSDLMCSIDNTLSTLNDGFKSIRESVDEISYICSVQSVVIDTVIAIHKHVDKDDSTNQVED